MPNEEANDRSTRNVLKLVIFLTFAAYRVFFHQNVFVLGDLLFKFVEIFLAKLIKIHSAIFKEVFPNKIF